MDGGGKAPLLLGSAAVAAGAAFLWNAGALPGMATRNLLAYLLGLLAGWGTHKIAHRRFGAVALFAGAALILLLVLAAGSEVDGVQRWLALGPFSVQPALILAPLLLAIVASREGRHWRVAILLPIVLVALQPDAATLVAMSGGVAAMMAAASVQSVRGWTARRKALAAAAACLAAIGIVFSGIQTPPAVAFVEGTAGIAAVSGGFAIFLHAVAIVAAVVALAVAGGTGGAALATYFALAALAALFWAFPMPVVGAGPSHLVGFGLAIGWLAERHQALVSNVQVSAAEA